MEQDEETQKRESFDPDEGTVPGWLRRHDVRLWASGILFMLAVIGAMFGIGAARGWDANSGYSYNTSESTRERFLPEPFVEEPGVKGRYGPDAAGRWYFWKLPPDEVTWYTRMFVWTCYCCHQIFVWIVQYKFHTEKVQGNKTYSTSLGKWNYFYFGINAFFHLLHLLQTHLTYDATAQDVSVVSSQCSVILVLTFITLLEYRDRGLFFGWPTRAHTDKWSSRLRLNYAPIYIIRRYHGYLCAWGSVYTLWYHPMENTWGHALGFFHTWMILLQGSLMFSKFHLNPYWRLLQEVWVGLHAGVVASQTGGPELDGTKLWPMFVFGFVTLFSLTHVIVPQSDVIYEESGEKYILDVGNPLTTVK
ncbi:uncharacterized protein LOC135464418 [Liolophura sinensis]|uniref:uncharacterized protein LOC135464418 n=1 Tax=Liolophura sinensis TaxID=3198878 RepID=UPI003158175B